MKICTKKLSQTSVENEDLKEKLNKMQDENKDLKGQLQALKVGETNLLVDMQKENKDLKCALQGLKVLTDQEIAIMKERLNSSNTITTNMLLQKSPRCYLEFAINGRSIGRVTINLYYQDAPNHCRKFIQLVIGEAGFGYMDAKVDRITSEFFRVGFHLLKKATVSGYSTNKFKTPPEKTKNKHERKGLISMMTPYGKTETEAGFAILSLPYPNLDNGRNIVIGQITEDSWCLDEVWEVPCGDYKGSVYSTKNYPNETPIQEIKVIDCGLWTY